MDISTDMDALKKTLLARLLTKRARLIKLRDKHMIFSAHVQIKALDKNIQDVINGKCGF